MRIKYQSTINEKGELKIFDRLGFMREVKLMAGQDVWLSVEKLKRNRSNNQNRYYWSVVVKLCRAGLIDVGYRVSNEQTHDFLKSNFAVKELVNESTGEILTSIGSTTDMSTVDFMDYLDKISIWASEYLSVSIPEPEEQVELNF